MIRQKSNYLTVGLLNTTCAIFHDLATRCVTLQASIVIFVYTAGEPCCVSWWLVSLVLDFRKNKSSLDNVS